MAQPIRFSAADDEQVIELVAEHAILWDMSHSDFKNAFKKDMIWNEIGEMVNKTGKQCKLRWKNIRDHYKKVKKQEQTITAGSAGKKKRASYWDRLMFLDAVQDERDIMTNPEIPTGSEEENIVETCEQVVVESVSTRAETPPKTATKRYRQDNKVVELLENRHADRKHFKKYLDKLIEPKVEDETDLFFKTMAATVKKFQPAMRTLAKSKIFNIVTDLEMQHVGIPEVGIPVDCELGSPSSVSLEHNNIAIIDDYESSSSSLVYDSNKDPSDANFKY